MNTGLNFFFAIPLIFLINIVHPLTGQEQDQRDDPKGVYKLPHEVITKDDLTKLKNSSADPNVEIDKQIEDTTLLLAKYYSQFIGEKRIWEDRAKGEKYNIKADPASVRILINDFLTRKSESGQTRDSEILFHLHVDLAALYEKKQLFNKAIASNLQAFRYRDLSTTEEYFIKEARKNEILNPEELSASEIHNRNFQDLIRSKESLKKAEDETHLIEAGLARNQSNFSQNDLTLNNNKKENARKSLLQAETVYKESLRINFEPFRKTKAKENADTVMKLAILIKAIENENKERLKIINKSAESGKGIFVLFDYKRNTNYFAYDLLLELAHKLDPTNADIVKLIAEESKSSGKKQNAIDFFLKFIKLKENGSPASSTNSLGDTYLSMAILYSDLKRYVQAGECYEKYLETASDQNKKNNLYYQLGEFYGNHLGDREKSALYFTLWLENLKNSDGSSIAFIKQLENRSGSFNANYGIALLKKYQKKRDEEKEFLQTAFAQYKELKNILGNEEKNYTAAKKELLEIKNSLLSYTNDESLAKFRLLEIKLNDADDRVKTVRTKYDRMRKTDVLFRLVILEEESRNFAMAKEYYKEIIDVGTETEIEISLRNIERLDKIARDGISRPPIL
ncbi:MAG: hypothetical protein K8R21_02800 [Leptospira sp.]|nr:hypothetical protein [Leptospira sp.]